ncbi:MAG: hypothetical protein CHACPFDD_03397 [Phycisphaerae bacterium]|nr:hypothetical protein [Phycisphaerae bacterium]
MPPISPRLGGIGKYIRDASLPVHDPRSGFESEHAARLLIQAGARWIEFADLEVSRTDALDWIARVVSSIRSKPNGSEELTRALERASAETDRMIRAANSGPLGRVLDALSRPWRKPT